jgi:cobalt-zinc-cadmium efflux system protein
MLTLFSGQALVRRIQIALGLTAAIFVAEVAGGLGSNSLALLTDAGHVLVDLIALGLTWFGLWQADRPSSGRMTFGYHRVGIVVAVVNSLTVIGAAMVIFYEAWRRLSAPEPVKSGLMLSVALVGLVVNLGVVFLLAGQHAGSLNVRSAFLHVAGDALASLAVVLGGFVILFTSWYWVDPALSVVIAGVILFGAWRILRESTAIFIEASPAHVDVENLVGAMKQVSGVLEVHDLHVWSIAPGLHALSCHMLVDDDRLSRTCHILEHVNELLERRYHIAHSTIQLESAECDPNALYCTLSPEAEPHHAHA